ncbi:hypothetical protein BDY24DRAFT_338590 [Mrakia frigida]|uniref:uncharacterized protein n=1 Tax=Mrakia frigida TaxID=29902 RepID=UPI003FCC0CB9
MSSLPSVQASPLSSTLSSPPSNATSTSSRRWRIDQLHLSSRRALDEEEDYDCRPYGNCEACPKDQKSEPFCQPYGNRRLLHCVPKGHLHHSEPHDPSLSEGEQQHEKEIPAWEACGKVITVERNDYWEFVTTNLLFFVLSMVILLLRSRKLAGLQYRMLAARIGLPGSSSGGNGRFLGFSL